MPFSHSHTNTVCGRKKQLIFLKLSRIISGKRAFLFISLKSSLTLEAAIALTTFLFCMVMLTGILQVMLVQMHLMVPLEQTAAQLARAAYVYQAEESSGSGALGYVVTAARAASVMKGKVNGDYLKDSGVVGGVSGLSFWQSQLSGGSGVMDLVVSYQVRLPFQLFVLPYISVRQCRRVHSWTGYDRKTEGQQEQMVFVTPSGTVYHCSVTCTYLKLHIRSVSASAVDSLRNESGGKYYPCERCGGGRGTVYITVYGDRYHGSLTCSGLKRGVEKIPISQVGNKKACSRCGQQE